MLFSFGRLQALLTVLTVVVFSFPSTITSTPSLVVGSLNRKRYLMRVGAGRQCLLLPIRRIVPSIHIDVVIGGGRIGTTSIHLTIGEISCFIPLSLSNCANGGMLLGFGLNSGSPMQNGLSTIYYGRVGLTSAFSANGHRGFHPACRFSPLCN